MKKRIVFVFAGLVAAAMLCACGADKAETSEATSAAETAPKTTAKAEESSAKADTDKQSSDSSETEKGGDTEEFEVASQTWTLKIPDTFTKTTEEEDLVGYYTGIDADYSGSISITSGFVSTFPKTEQEYLESETGFVAKSAVDNGAEMVSFDYTDNGDTESYVAIYKNGSTCSGEGLIASKENPSEDGKQILTSISVGDESEVDTAQKLTEEIFAGLKQK